MTTPGTTDHPLIRACFFDARCHCGHAALEHKDTVDYGAGRCYRCLCSQFSGLEAEP